MISNILSIQDLTHEYTDHEMKYSFMMTDSRLVFSYTFEDSNGKVVEQEEDAGPNNETTRGAVSIMIHHAGEFYHTLPTSLKSS